MINDEPIMLERLRKLYSAQRDSGKTPLEDFTTEVLAGILEINPDLCDDFAKSVLKLEGTHFKAETQKKFPLPDDPDCKIDLILSNSDTVCFVENKVNSGEMTNQLDRYARALNHHFVGDESKNKKQTFLRYCTKKVDPKYETRHHFRQFRWSDVAAFLHEHKDSENQFVAEFLTFLTKHGMNIQVKFDEKEITAMTQFQSLVMKMDEVLALIKPEFKKHFGERIKDGHNNFWQIKTYKRYIFFKPNVHPSAYSEIGAGFEFAPIPQLMLWLWLDKDFSEMGKVKKQAEELKKPNSNANVSFDAHGCLIGFGTPLTSFSNSEDTGKEIKKWFSDRMIEMEVFLEKCEVTWNLD